LIVSIDEIKAAVVIADAVLAQVGLICPFGVKVVVVGRVR
jgi:hypothetical protein